MKKFMKNVLRVLLMLLLVMSILSTREAYAARIKLNATQKTTYVGKQFRLKLKGASGKVIWSTSDKSVATVNKGRVTAINQGTAVITAKNSGKSYTCKVNVLEPKNSFDPTAYGDDQHLRTTNNPDNYVDFSIQDSTLFVSGKIILDGLTDLMVKLDEQRITSPATTGNDFLFQVPLTSITQKTEVRLYTKVGNDTCYWSYIYRVLYIEPKSTGGYRIMTSLVLKDNIEILKNWVDPKDCLGDGVSKQVQKLSDSIVGNETDTYKKLWLINEWVADNIYYDYDFYYGRSNDIVYDSDHVYENKRSVCAGYANLQCDLIRAQGIPCMEVFTFSAGVSTKGYFDETNCNTTTSNHAHVEAYLEEEDRWVTMDATWDSRNKYENGEYKYQAPSITYFDCNLDFFSLSHKIIER